LNITMGSKYFRLRKSDGIVFGCWRDNGRCNDDDDDATKTIGGSSCQTARINANYYFPQQADVPRSIK
jgi:hypothetical protein